MDYKLLIDVGNSNIKWRFQNQDYQAKLLDFNLSQLPNAKEVWMSCVNREFQLDNAKTINKRPYKNLSFNYSLNDLGVDRYLAIIASYKTYPNTNLLIIDVGTAITYDLLIDSIHLGGTIAPGLEVLRRSLPQFTTDKRVCTENIATNTKNAWYLGTQNMVDATIQYTITKLSNQYQNLKIILTGSGGKHYKTLGIYHKNLVLDGLEIISNNE